MREAGILTRFTTLITVQLVAGEGVKSQFGAASACKKKRRSKWNAAQTEYANTKKQT